MGTQYVCQHKLKLFSRDKLATGITLFTKFTASPIMLGLSASPIMSDLSASPQTKIIPYQTLVCSAGNLSYYPQLRNSQQAEPSSSHHQ
jgi:hypothetical protein